jgi:hypothetical protein
MMRGARIGKKDRRDLDPFSVQDAETLIAAQHRDWGAAQANYDAFRFFTGLRPSEEIALIVSDYDRANGVLSISKARVASDGRRARGDDASNCERGDRQFPHGSRYEVRSADDPASRGYVSARSCGFDRRNVASGRSCAGAKNARVLLAKKIRQREEAESA